MKYSKLNLGQIEALVNKLGGEDGVKALLSGEAVIINRPAYLEYLRIALDFYKENIEWEGSLTKVGNTGLNVAQINKELGSMFRSPTEKQIA